MDMSMEGLQWGMFWGGAVMAAAPVALGIAITVFLIREYQQDRREGRDQPPHRE